jgi:hypothetical protein
MAQWYFQPSVVDQVKGVPIKFCSFNIIIPSLNKPKNTYCIYKKCGFYSHCLHTTSRNVAVQSFSITETFHSNLCDIKHKILLGDMIKVTVYPNLQCKKGLFCVCGRACVHACMESRQTVLPTSDIKMQKDY